MAGCYRYDYSSDEDVEGLCDYISDDDVEELCEGIRSISHRSGGKVKHLCEEQCKFFDALQHYGMLERFEFIENLERSKEVFGLMMRAFYGKNENDKFQPCQDEFDILKGMVKAAHLCHDLRKRTTLQEFYQILLPGNWKQSVAKSYKLIGRSIDYLKNKDSIFHIHQNIADDKKEFEDLKKRAEKLASEVDIKYSCFEKTEVQLLDGHGRMLVLLLEALDRKNISLENIRWKVFEIDDIVHEYHEYVFNNRIENIKGCIINQDPLPSNGVIYLNFCSIKPAKTFEWTSHFDKQDARNYKRACIKENVLRFIAKVTNDHYKNTVMISFVIKQSSDSTILYQNVFNESLGYYLTGLGLLYILRNDFDAEIVSIRPDSEIIWVDDKNRLLPKKLRSGGRSCPFVTLLVKPGDYSERLNDRFTDGCPSTDTIQQDSRVKVLSERNQGRVGRVVSLNEETALVQPLDRRRRKEEININHLEIANRNEDTIQQNSLVKVLSGRIKGIVGRVVSLNEATANVLLDGRHFLEVININQLELIRNYNNKIADLKEDTIQRNSHVEVLNGRYKGRVGCVVSRTATLVKVLLDGERRERQFNINQLATGRSM